MSAYRLDESAKGVYIISATPFSDDGSLDLDSTDRLVDFYVEKGVSGITVLGMMGELGDKSAAYHLALSPLMAAANVDYAILVGEQMQILAEALNSGVEGPAKFDHCSNAQEALLLLQENLQPGDAILVKGSNFLGLSKIISALTAGEN